MYICVYLDGYECGERLNKPESRPRERRKRRKGRWREQGHTSGMKVERGLEKQGMWRSEYVVS